MRAKWAPTCILLAFAASGAAAQTHPGQADMSSVYCSGIVTSEAVPQDSYIISGEDSNIRITYRMGDSVFINHGSDHNLKEGDEFLVVRPQAHEPLSKDHDPLDYEWFKGQFMLMHAMGTLYQDMGRIKVMKVGPKVATAQVEFACNPMQRGDIILPFVERALPAVRNEPLTEKFEISDGKAKTGMIVSTYGWGQLLGTNGIGYVNLGTTEGLQVGSYVRVFRFAGPTKEVVPQERDSAFYMYGWGTTPVRYMAEELPRDVIGEAVVLRVTNHTATVMVTAMRRDMYPGDYVEIQK